MIQKYAAALISIALVAFAFLKTALADELDAAEVAQLIALVAGAVTVYLVPLLAGRWAGALKTGAALVAAAATAIAPLVLQGQITPEQWTIVALAVLNALGVEVGVQARTSAILATHAQGTSNIDQEASTVLRGQYEPTGQVDAEGARALWRGDL